MIQVTDLLTVSMMLGITAQVKEAGIAWDKGEKKSECCPSSKAGCDQSFLLSCSSGFRSGGAEVFSESNRCHPERCCVVASFRGSYNQ